ncbi:MAG: hypothetical protein WC143_05305 [Eubacteriales bacterium]|jgi:hypothetical protein
MELKNIVTNNKQNKNVAINYQQKETESSLTGYLYFSKKQYRKHRDEGRDRMFAKLIDGRTVEYTELISLEAMSDDLFVRPMEEDSLFIGEGAFDYFADEKGREYK